MECSWKDVRKVTLQFYREIFIYLEELDILDMESRIDRVCLFIVFQPRIQKSLDETLIFTKFGPQRTKLLSRFTG
jgi:hypothetical protein